MDKESKAILDKIPRKSDEPAGAALLTFTNFTRKDLMYIANGKIYGNWRPSFGGACVTLLTSYIYE